MALRLQSLSSYRQLLRSINRVFRADAPALRRTRELAGQAFRQHAGETDVAVIRKLVDDAKEAASFLAQNVAQAKLNDDGHYALRLDPAHSDSSASAGVQLTAAADAAATAAAKPGTSAGGCCGGGCR